MKRLALATVISGLLPAVGLAQIPGGTYTFTSGAGVGTPPFSVTGAAVGSSPTSLGGFVVGPEAGCGGIHVHGTFNSFLDPLPSGCGHGIISLFVAPPPVSGGSLPGGVPTNVAGQLSLTANPGAGGAFEFAGDAFLAGVVGFANSVGGLSRDDGEFTYAAWKARGALDLLVNATATDSVGLDKLIGIAGESIREAIELGRRSAVTEPDPETGKLIRTSLDDNAPKILVSPSTTSLLEEFAAYDDQAAEGYKRDAERSSRQAEEWRKLAEDARREAERNRQRAEEARRNGQEEWAKDWEREAERDEKSASDRDAQAERLDGWSEDAERREQAARDQAQERRDAAERAREAVRQAERDRAERARQQAEEKARIAREEREARQARERRERAERDERDRRELERQRARAQLEHQRWLDQQQREREARARGSATRADALASSTRQSGKAEEEEKTWADYVVEYSEGVLGWAKDKLLGKVKDKVKETAMERSGANAAIDNLGLSKSLGKLSEGVDQIQAVKKLGDSMEAELRRRPQLRQRIEDRIDELTSTRTPRGTERRNLSSGSLYGREFFGTTRRMVEANK